LKKKSDDLDKETRDEIWTLKEKNRELAETNQDLAGKISDYEEKENFLHRAEVSRLKTELDKLINKRQLDEINRLKRRLELEENKTKKLKEGKKQEGGEE
jgi:hypothetical protein